MLGFSFFLSISFSCVPVKPSQILVEKFTNKYVENKNCDRTWATSMFYHFFTIFFFAGSFPNSYVHNKAYLDF